MRAHGCQHHAVTFGRSSTTAFAHKAASYNVVGPQMPCEISRRTQACINYTAGRRWLCSVRPPSRPPRHTEPRMRARCGCAPSAFRSWNIGRSQDARKQSGRQTRSIERAELVNCSEQQLHTWDKVVNLLCCRPCQRTITKLTSTAFSCARCFLSNPQDQKVHTGSPRTAMQAKELFMKSNAGLSPQGLYNHVLTLVVILDCPHQAPRRVRGQ